MLTGLSDISSMLDALKKRSKENTSSFRGTRDLIYAIGDIHGRADLLATLLEKIRIDTHHILATLSDNPKLYIVFLGDYIDRGHDSKAVLESLINLRFDRTEMIYLKGNHEAIAMECIDTGKINKKWLRFGGRETLASYGVDTDQDMGNSYEMDYLNSAMTRAFPSDHIDFLRSLKSYWIHDQYMFVHAGIDPAQHPESQTDAEYLWIRNRFLNSIRKLPYVIVHGHTPQEKPSWDGRRIGVDTGAYISNRLTAVRLHGEDVAFITT